MFQVFLTLLLMPFPAFIDRISGGFLWKLSCYQCLSHGLAASTHNSCTAGQKKFIQFCTRLGKLHSSGSPCLTATWTLCLFVTFLSGFLQHSSVKVYLSAVRSLNIKESFPDPLLLNCFRLQQGVKGIKHAQGSCSYPHLPITHGLMMVIFKSLDLAVPNHCMFWAACNLAYFGFLQSAEFRVPNLASFSTVLHLGVQDIEVHSDTNPSSLCIRIKASKIDPFCKGCFIRRGHLPLCTLQLCLPVH